MPEPTAPPAPAPTVSADALRIVLFGMPDAGKSSLLGALAQAAQTQEHLLNGHLTDLSHGLAELQRRLYENEPRETLEEIIPYPVAFEPFAPPGQPADARLEAVLVDCDGRVANELLARRRSLDADSREGSLAGEILEADALLLVVDAGASPAQVEADFTEFGRFLRLLEKSRGRRSDVGGLPVFLVLTKCDLLAQVRDSAAVWIERIEDRKRQVDARFREFLARQTAEGPLPFGSIDLHLWATAVKRPELAGAPAKPREPYGVAELFRQLLGAAQAFRGREARAGRRLAWTVGGSAGLLAGMLALSVALLANRDTSHPTALLNQVEAYRSREAQTGTGPSARLREPLQPKISELTDLKSDPEFATLPASSKEYVEGRLQELLEYREYQKRVLAARAPADARSEKDLDRTEAALRELAPPPERKAAWSQTEAALLREQRLEEVKALRAAVVELDDWYRRIIRRGEDLWAFAEHRPRESGPIPWRDWHTQVQALLDEAENPPHAPGDRLAVGSRMTYATVFGFDRITEDRAGWDAVRQRLQRLRDLTAALGLAGTQPPAAAPGDPPASALHRRAGPRPAAGSGENLPPLPARIQPDRPARGRGRRDPAGRPHQLRERHRGGPGGRAPPPARRQLRGPRDRGGLAPPAPLARVPGRSAGVARVGDAAGAAAGPDRRGPGHRPGRLPGTGPLRPGAAPPDAGDPGRFESPAGRPVRADAAERRRAPDAGVGAGR
jgi:hypothetical protein